MSSGIGPTFSWTRCEFSSSARGISLWPCVYRSRFLSLLGSSLVMGQGDRLHVVLRLRPQLRPSVNVGRKLTPFQRLKVDPLVFILRLSIPGLSQGRGL